ncbi:MAG: AAA family ATPase, partial [Anaerolineales bacterium]
MTTLFDSTATVKAELNKQKYIASDEIATIVYLAQKLGKPLLAEGPAGVGKTELAKAIANATGRELIRLQCYEGLDESKALYEWEYSKQLLYTQLLRDKLNDTLGKADTLAGAADQLAKEEDVFFSERFLLKRPLLKAILSDQPSVLLIDEIDKADIEFPNDLLHELDKMSFYVYETGETITATQRPIVIITSNNEKELPDAFLRRCFFHYIEFPDEATMREIIDVHFANISTTLVNEALQVFFKLRQIPGLKKLPSTSELIDWLSLLMADDMPEDILRNTDKS